MKYTILSLFPKEILEEIPTYNPTQYVIPAGPAVFNVPEDVFYVRYLGEGKSIQIPVSAEEIGREIVRSFTSTLEEIAAPIMPAVAVFSDKDKYLTIAEIKQRHPIELGGLTLNQNTWFNRLVKRADDSWQVKRQHRLITESQKLAAKALNLKREWSEISQPEDMQGCPACGEILGRSVGICRACGCVVNETLIKDLKFAGKRAS